MPLPLYQLDVPSDAWVTSMDDYRERYEKSIEKPHQFWAEVGRKFHWEKEFKEDEVLRYNFDIRKGPVFIKWFENAETNIAYNALDRNVKEGLGDKIAYLW
ncbi:acetyl-coenzyme A synthetase [Caerostris darwini]|uniref:Acetyl-coenzyme A synthetase n=1 Tax=Caerostris darwini TaxID=1538125 RepID=A0AAV4U042_9ARAC|nr:acetyl-coenzyme A synthetase [Caerostris darwini]